MWIVRLALNRPYTFVVMSLLILILSPIVVMRTSVDIFPNIDIPVISIIWQYSGLSPQEMADRIVSNSERGLTTTVNDVEHIESTAYPGKAVEKVFFQPGTNIPLAMGQITSAMNSALRGLPQGITPAQIIQYSASNVPIMQIGISSPEMSEQELNDVVGNFLRPQLVTVRGAMLPGPYGGKQRVMAVDIDTAAMQSKGVTPVDVVNAFGSQNLILPSGTAKMGEMEYNVKLNGSPTVMDELNSLPIRSVNGTTIYVRDVAHVRDGFSPQTNVVRQDAKRGVLQSILKNGNTSTLDIVKNVRGLLPQVSQLLPDSLKIEPMFDQSLFVRSAIQGVLREALVAACLTAIMILLFLGNWRSTLIIATSIPLSILCSIIVLSALGESFNLMTLGGLALAVGILVDDATVEIENIERNLSMGKELRTAILDGASQIAVPAFVSTLCICIVFIPMFFLSGVARFLFVPLAEAVVFAMLASYFLSRTIVPTMVQYLLKGHEHDAHTIPPSPGIFKRFQVGFERRFENLRRKYRAALLSCLERRGIFIPAFLGFCVASLGIVFILGQDFFPNVDAGVFRLHVRARPGLRIEEMARLCDQVEQVIRQDIPKEELGTVLDNIGMPYSSINLSYSTGGTVGTSDAEVLVSLNQKHRPTADYVRRFREVLPQAFPGVEFFFQPADIVSQILNFGLPSPIDVQVVGRDNVADYYMAQKISNRMHSIPGAVDVHVHQMMSDPEMDLNVDRTRAQEVGLDQMDVAQNLMVSLSGSFQTAPTFWLNPQNGVTYNVVVSTPDYHMNSMDALMNTPVNSAAMRNPTVLANLATVKPTSTAAVVTHYNIIPVADIYASVQDRDLGGVAADVKRVMQEFEGKLPRGMRIVMRGQVETMNSSFFGLGVGIAMAIVLVYLLIVVNFQSWLDPFIIITALPGALAGICWMLLLTHTTLNVPSLTGAVMCMGVATANSILMVSFARERMDEGMTAWDAALQAGYIRMRPVVMTALAMIIGMVPMALGLGDGGEQNAPLGRAVIGGLIFATVATLFFVPVVFSIMHRNTHMAALPAHVSEQE